MTARRLAAALVGTLAVVLTTAGGASAHARYASSTPAKGEVLSASPAQVVITFSQEVQKVSGLFGISVTDASGAEHTAGGAQVDDADRTRLSVALQPSLPTGRYVVSWKNVSDADADPAEGAFSFYVGVEPNEADLALDAELAAAEEEEPTPAAQETATSSRTAGPTATSTSIPVDVPKEGDGSGNTGIWIAVIAAAAGVVVGFGAMRWRSARRK